MIICDRCGGKNDVQRATVPLCVQTDAGQNGATTLDLCEPCRFTYHNMVDGFLNHYKKPAEVRTWYRSEVEGLLTKAVLEYGNHPLTGTTYADNFIRTHL